MKRLLTFISLLFAHYSFAQDTVSDVPIDTFQTIIHSQLEGGGQRFKAELRPLVQVPGGRTPFYTYLWDFGDGHFSTEANPFHQYAKPGEYEVSIYAVNNYDDGPRPKRPKKKIKVDTQLASNPIPNRFEQSFFSANQTFQIFKNCNAIPGQDMSLVVGVNTGGKKGKIYLLTNEKIAGLAGFSLAEQSRYYNEKIDSAVKEPQMQQLWATVKQSTLTKSGSPAYGIKEEQQFKSEKDAISYFSNLYEAYQTVSTYEVDPSNGETQFALVNLDITPEMLVDTNAIVTISGVFIPEDGLANVHQVDVPIIKSHDPNKMSIRPARMNYRLQMRKKKTMTYKVQFQNDGEGDAKNVRLEMQLPKEVDKDSFKLIALYPECDSCETASSRGCYRYYLDDTGKLVFHFKDISLPGTGAPDVTDQDSTQGFILFSVHTTKRLQNKSFKAHTDIYFDKNEPIRTNTATSRFRKGFSPIVTFGLNSSISGDLGENDISKKYTNGIALGVGLAPIAPYKKPYWQVELYATTSGLNTDNPRVDGDGVVADPEYGDKGFQYIASQTSLEQRFLHLSIPAQVRYNFNRYLSAGIGAMARLQINTKNESTTSYFGRGASGVEASITRLDVLEKEKTSKILWNPFVDINLGFVYLGPSVGFRYNYDKNVKHTANIYALWRF